MADQHNEPVVGYPVASIYIGDAPGTTEPNSLFKSQCFKCVSGFACFAVILMLFVFFMKFIIVSGVDPPYFEANCTVSMLKLSGNQMSADWEIYFNVTNPNEVVSFDYQNVSVKVSYNNFYQGKTTVYPFRQKAMGRTSLHASVRSFSVDVDEAAATKMALAKKEGGSVEFSLRVEAYIGLDWGILKGKEKPKKMKVSCNGIHAVVRGKGIPRKAPPLGFMDCVTYVEGLQ